MGGDSDEMEPVNWDESNPLYVLFTQNEIMENYIKNKIQHENTEKVDQKVYTNKNGKETTDT